MADLPLESSHPRVQPPYPQFFEQMTGNRPFAYQEQVADHLFNGRNLVLRAPTGAGKTWSVLVPFLLTQAWRHRPSKLIYVLPLRTLAESIYREARRLFERAGWDADKVTLQTGEQPDDPFFDTGHVILATYDQLLSGLLEHPYGLSDRLHNINAAAVAGALVVFDEFHLMEPGRAFMTANAMLTMFAGLCQSVWMTATATEPLVDELRRNLDAVTVPASMEEWQDLVAALPTVKSVDRSLNLHESPLTAEAVLSQHRTTSIAITNTVDRAQALYRALVTACEAQHLDVTVVLLHSRFFRTDRRDKEARLQELFGKQASRSAILIATQVVEAGIDISCEHLHTELCPMNSLVQRAGRCARYPGQTGVVHAYELPDNTRTWLPYGDLEGPDPTLLATQQLLQGRQARRLDPLTAADWVQSVHAEADLAAVRDGVQSRINRCTNIIGNRVTLHKREGVAELIREPDADQLRVIVCDERRLPELPSQREAITIGRWSLRDLIRDRGVVGWRWSPAEEVNHWQPLGSVDELATAYTVCLRPEVARYSKESGLHLGASGTETSPPRRPPQRPGYPAGQLVREPWIDHARNVAQEAIRRHTDGNPADGLLLHGLQDRYNVAPNAVSHAVRLAGLLHDLGKLQAGWQRWAELAQQAKDAGYVHRVPLAHTDFNPEDPADRERERQVALQAHRPTHATASCYYSYGLLAALMRSAGIDVQPVLASAVLSAVVAHHGGWWSDDHEAPPMVAGWEGVAGRTLGVAVDGVRLRQVSGQKVDDLLKTTTGPEQLENRWPVTAYLTRTLRLADQRATSEIGHE